MRQLATLALLFSVAALAQTPPTAPAAPSASVVKPASAPVADANAIRVLLAPEVETTLVAQMAGRIEVLNASLGQPVVKGKLLVGIECGESQARLRMAEAELAAARDTLTGKTGLKQLNAAGDLEVSTAQAAVEQGKRGSFPRPLASCLLFAQCPVQRPDCPCLRQAISGRECWGAAGRPGQ